MVNRKQATLFNCWQCPAAFDVNRKFQKGLQELYCRMKTGTHFQCLHLNLACYRLWQACQRMMIVYQCCHSSCQAWPQHPWVYAQMVGQTWLWNLGCFLNDWSVCLYMYAVYTLLTLGSTPDVFLGAWFLAEVKLMPMHWAVCPEDQLSNQVHKVSAHGRVSCFVWHCKISNEIICPWCTMLCQEWHVIRWPFWLY